MPSDELGNLLSLLEDACTNTQLKIFLKSCKERSGDKKIRVSAKNTDEYLRWIREAYDRNSITLNQLRLLLADAEENGHQHIFLFKPKRGHKDFYTDPQAVAKRFFGAKWPDKTGLPNFVLEPEDWVMGDFRVDEGKTKKTASGWTVKFYAKRTVSKTISEKTTDLARGQRVTKVFDVIPIRLALVVKWRPFNVLEIRIPSGQADSKGNCLKELDRFWREIRDGVTQSHFSKWDLRPAIKFIVDNASKNPHRYRVSTTMADHNGATAIFSPKIEGNDLFEDDRHRQGVSLYDDFEQVDWYLKPNPANPAFEGEMRVQIGCWEKNEVRIGSKASPEAVDYVIFRLREYGRA